MERAEVGEHSGMTASLTTLSRGAVAAWRQDATRRSAALRDANLPREDQMDARRRLESLARTTQAVDQLAAAPRRRGQAPRVLVVHRAEWFRRGVRDRLGVAGLDVVTTEDGSLGLAHVVVDQPVLVLLEDLLPWVTGPELIRAARQYAPRALLVAVTEDPGSGDDCLAAGASARFSRFLPLDQLCSSVLGMLSHAQVA